MAEYLNNTPVEQQYARFTTKALAEAKCQEIAAAKADDWAGRAYEYAVPFKPEGQTKWYVIVLPSYEDFFSGMTLVPLD
jgi:hypothetical protein